MVWASVRPDAGREHNKTDKHATRSVRRVAWAWAAQRGLRTQQMGQARSLGSPFGPMRGSRAQQHRQARNPKRPQAWAAQ
eukprot:6948866-Alexandrium_andersonii.AAC.1